MAVLMLEGEVKTTHAKIIYALYATNKGFKLTTKEMNPLILCADTVKVFTTTKELEVFLKRKDIFPDVIEDITSKLKKLREGFSQ